MGRWSVAPLALSAKAGYLTRRALGAPARGVQDVALRDYIVSPGIDEPAIRPTIPESHLQRIQGGWEGQTAEGVLADLNTLRHVARPTRAYVLKDVVLFDRQVHCGGYKGDLFRGSGFWTTLVREPAGEMESAVLGTTYAGARWFGHLLHDEFPLQELAAQLGEMVGHARPLYGHEPGWRKTFALPSPALFGMLRVRELTILDDAAQNPGKVRRYSAMRSRIESGAAQNDRVVLVRGDTGGEERRIANQEEVYQRLVREGFHLIDTSAVGVDEIVKRCAGASIIVSVEGSHATPALFLAREGAVLLFIYPPRRVTLLLPRLATFFGLKGAMFIGENQDDSPGVFKVDPDELVRLIDQVSERPRNSLRPMLLPGAPPLS